MTSRGKAGEPPAGVRLGNRDRLEAAAAALAAFALYWATACRTIYTGDCPEIAGAIAVFGVMHPPGYPLFTFLSALLARLVPVADRAFAANLVSGFYGAAAVASAWLLLRRWGAGRVGAWFGASALALGRTFWTQSAAAEVYTFDLLLLTLAFHASWSASLRPTARSLFVAALTIGLWIGHRFVNVVYLVPLLLVAWRGGWPRLSRWWLLPVSAGVALSALPYVYLPLASAADPAINVGDPRTWDRFRACVSAEVYLRHLRGVTPSLMLLHVKGYFASWPVEIGAAWVFAVFGVPALWREARRRMAAGLLLLVVANVAVAARYNILDINTYFLPSVLAVAGLGAVGAGRIVAAVARSTGRAASLAACGLVLACGLVGLPLNLSSCDLHDQRAARHLGEDLLASAAPDGVLLTHGDTTIHSLWYLQGVEHREPDVVVVSLGHLDDWMMEQLARRHPRDPWPAFTKGAPLPAQAQRIAESLSRSRPLYFTFTTDPDDFAAEGRRSAWFAAHGILPRGIVQLLNRRGTPLDLRALTARNLAFWAGALGRVRPIGSNVDDEMRSILLEYALALSKNGEFLRNVGRGSDAIPLYRKVVELDPDRHEAELLSAFLATGRSFPRLDLGKQALLALGALQAVSPGGPEMVRPPHGPGNR
jgi:hypothetical protein